MAGTCLDSFLKRDYILIPYTGPVGFHISNFRIQATEFSPHCYAGQSSLWQSCCNSILWKIMINCYSFI